MEKRIIMILVLSLSSLSGLSHACMDVGLLNQSFKVKGIATSIFGDALYHETLIHNPDSFGGTLRVEYRSPDGQPIANKIVDYRCNPTAPSFQLTDVATGEMEGVLWDADQLIAFSGATKKVLTAPDHPLIVDAGFDNAIKLKWDILISGLSVEYQYLLARKGRFFNLTLSQSAPPKVLQNEVKPEIVFFKINPSNRFLALFADPIFVGYLRQNRTLAYYYGPTNLPMYSEHKNVVIRYKSAVDTTDSISTQNKPTTTHSS